jgi:transcriptional regulator with XRE-family HTH domain
MDMGERIKIARKAKGWSQIELAEKIGLTSGGMSGIESNKRDASKTTIVKLSETLGVSADYLLFGVENKQAITESEQEILEVLREDKAMTNAVMEFAKVKKKAISFTRSYAAANQNAVMG